MRVVIYLGGELAQNLFVRGSVYFFEGCSQVLCIFSFLFSLDTLVIANFVHMFLMYAIFYLLGGVVLSLIYIYIYDDNVVITFTYLFMYCFFYFFIHMFLMYAIFYFCFTLRCLDEFCLKCFRKIGCQNLSCHELFSCKVFQEFVLGLDFIVFNK